MFKKSLLVFSVILLAASTLGVVQSESFTLTLGISEHNYLGENIFVQGNLTLNDSPVTDGLVTIQVNDPRDNFFVLRTLTTGNDPPGPWTIEILELVIIGDMAGNPKTNFSLGEDIGLKYTFRNNGLSSHHVKIILHLFDSNGIPFFFRELYDNDLEGGKWISKTTFPIATVENASLGPAFAYVNALNELPENSGFAYCPEKSATFNIVGGSSGEAYSVQESQSANTPGKFNLTFCTNAYGGLVGNYTIFAVSQYYYYFELVNATFQVFLLGDVNGDGKVRVDDVLAVAFAFGSEEGDPHWDPRCDLNGDHKVRVDDVLLAASNFGKGAD